MSDLYTSDAIVLVQPDANDIDIIESTNENEDILHIPNASEKLSLSSPILKYDIVYASHMYRLGLRNITCGYVFYQLESSTREWAGGYWIIAIASLSRNLHHNYSYIRKGTTVLYIRRYFNKIINLFIYPCSYITRDQALIILRTMYGTSENSIRREFINCRHTSIFEILSPRLDDVTIDCST